ncbi:MAG: hypothetical protein LC781_06790 [Actinobacteria bacterium]|nr:hypothetical protein [Actinomycetota bacterium]
MNIEARRAAKQLPIACKLPDERLGPRREELSRELFDGCELVRELEDGYEFVFRGEPERTAELARFVAAERECCRFFTFELLFEPDLGPISLRLRGPEGTKEFLRGHFTEEFSEKHSVEHG